MMKGKILRSGRWMTMAELEEDNEKFGEQRKRVREEKIRMLRRELKKLEEKRIDPGAPGTALEQRGDLMDDDERAEWIAAGMPEDWALLKEEEFAQGLCRKE